MALSEEDTLRLHILLANAQAVRIDEQAMCVCGLTGDREARVELAPNCKPEQYLRQVRELLAAKAVGSPRGYPVHLRRWTRMGQMQGAQLEGLLLLGEPEAVVAVACSPSLSAELARRAWWALPTPEVARHMLERPCVATSPLGPELAQHLLEFLPFEEEPAAIVDTVRLVLQPRLISDEKRLELWRRGRAKTTYYVGFLLAGPDTAPEQVAPRADAPALERYTNAPNPYVRTYAWVASAHGQTFLSAAEHVLRKPSNQDAVARLIEAMRRQLAPVRVEDGRAFSTIDAIVEHARSLCTGPDAGVRELLAIAGADRDRAIAMLALAHLSEGPFVPFFARSTAVGALMRRQLEPVTGPVLALMASLR